MFLEIGLQLLLGFAGIHQKFLACAECEPAEIAVRQAWRLADESHDLQIALRHCSHDDKAVERSSNLRRVLLSNTWAFVLLESHAPAKRPDSFQPNVRFGSAPEIVRMHFHRGLRAKQQG